MKSHRASHREIPVYSLLGLRNCVPSFARVLLKETVHTFFKAYEIFGTEILTRSDLDSQSN